MSFYNDGQILQTGKLQPNDEAVFVDQIAEI